MKTVIAAALAVLASTLGLVSSVQAQSTAAPSAETEDFTLSGDSLIGIESRTAEGDYRQFFGGNAPGRTSINRAEESYSLTKKRGLLQVSDDLELLINRESPQPINAVPFRENGRFNDNNRVEVKLDLDR